MAGRPCLHRYVGEFAFRLGDGDVSRHTLGDEWADGHRAKPLRPGQGVLESRAMDLRLHLRPAG